jgi:hypothetical protein
VHQAAQAEPGLRALLKLAMIRRDRALQNWTRAQGPDLVKFQSEYNTVQDVIDIITKAPREFQKPGA